MLRELIVYRCELSDNNVRCNNTSSAQEIPINWTKFSCLVGSTLNDS